MKRLILLGGRPWLAADGGERFADVLFRYFPDEVKIAFCIFAQPESEWEETRTWNINMFKQFRGERKLAYQTMTPENFAEVSAWADIVYVPGGDPFQLLENLKTCGDVGRLWDGKLIVGSSAGADLFCEGFTFLQDKTFGRGLGWVKASCVPHWRSEDFKGYAQKDWDEVEAESLRQLPNLPALCIPEGDFVECSVA